MEAEIVKKAKLGDEEAMRQLYQSSFTSLYRYVRFKVDNDQNAEDIVAEAFTRAFETIQKFRGESSFKTYVYSIARNLIKGFYSRKSVETEINEEVISSYYEEPEIDNNSLELKIRKVQAVLNDLSEKEKDVIECRYFSSMNVEQCAKALKLTKSNVKVITHRAVNKIKELIKNG